METSKDGKDKSILRSNAYDEKINVIHQHHKPNGKRDILIANTSVKGHRASSTGGHTEAASSVASEAKKNIRIKLKNKTSQTSMKTSQKGKGKRPNLEAPTEPSKRQNKGWKTLSARKNELESQIGRLFDLTMKQQRESEQRSEYTEARRKREETELNEAVSIFGKQIASQGQELDCPNTLYRVKGMPTTIRDYQVVGAAFMLRQERAKKDCLGGIIADNMGIGKTVQSIACMLAHPPTTRARKDGLGATLIIVPNQGLAKQWTEELWTHGGISPRDICRYAGPKMKANGIKMFPYV